MSGVLGSVGPSARLGRGQHLSGLNVDPLRDYSAGYRAAPTGLGHLARVVPAAALMR